MSLAPSPIDKTAGSMKEIGQGEDKENSIKSKSPTTDTGTTGTTNTDTTTTVTTTTATTTAPTTATTHDTDTLGIPHTPRVKGPRTGHTPRGVTPFNLLSFSPSFNFNSPIYAVSPNRFFNIPVGKVFHRKSDSISSMRDIFGTPSKRNVPRIEVEESDQSLDLWSTLCTDETNITIDDKKKDDKSDKDKFLTPLKLVKKDKTHVEDHSSLSGSPKRRRLNEGGIVDSPNNCVASTIDKAIESPHTVTAPIVDPSASDSDRVWHTELDDMLIACFVKYRNFREGNPQTKALKNTSQNKILSRMLYNKTGIMRTSKQISSRLFRLTKSKKLEKQSKYCKTYGKKSPDIATPFSAKTHNSGMLDSISTDIIDEELDFLMSPTHSGTGIKVSGVYLSCPNHVFSSLGQAAQISRSYDDLSLEPAILAHVRRARCPVFSMAHEVNVKTEFSADSPLEAYLRLAVERESYEPMVAWKTLTRVFKNNQCIHESVTMAHGYKQHNGLYDVRSPLMRTFFKGYLNFLVNGSLADSALTMTQILFTNSSDDDNILGDNSSLHAAFSHSFNFSESAPGRSNVFRILVSELDDNETVLADSSPPKHSSPDSKETPKPHQLQETNVHEAQHFQQVPMPQVRQVMPYYNPYDRPRQQSLDQAPYGFKMSPEMLTSTPMHVSFDMPEVYDPNVYPSYNAPKKDRKEFRFGPILEYDPSKDIKTIQKPVVKGVGTHRFPVNTNVSMYKPKKR